MYLQAGTCFLNCIYLERSVVGNNNKDIPNHKDIMGYDYMQVVSDQKRRNEIQIMKPMNSGENADFLLIGLALSGEWRKKPTRKSGFNSHCCDCIIA